MGVGLRSHSRNAKPSSPAPASSACGRPRPAPARPSGPDWVVTAPRDHTIRDVLDPAYLGPILQELVPGAEVAIRHEGHAFVCRLVVKDVDADTRAITTLPIEVIDLTAIAPIAPDYENFTVARRHGTAVVLRPDGTPLRSFASEAEARDWLAAKRLLGMATPGKAN